MNNLRLLEFPWWSFQLTPFGDKHVETARSLSKSKSGSKTASHTWFFAPHLASLLLLQREATSFENSLIVPLGLEL